MLILLTISFFPSVGSAFTTNCSNAFSADNHKPLTDALQKIVKPSIPSDRRRYDLEDFLGGLIGNYFQQNFEMLTIIRFDSHEQLTETVDTLSEIGLEPDHVSEQAMFIEYHLDRRRLENALYTLSPQQYFLRSKFLADEKVFEFDLKSHQHVR